MRVDGYGRTWQVEDVADLEKALAWRDSRGGGLFWLSQDGGFPTLAIRVSGDVADLHFFPEDGHPGFRCLGGVSLPEDGMTKLVFEGCDPEDGEETPNRFIVPLERAISVAREFLGRQQMPSAVSWFEL